MTDGARESGRYLTQPSPQSSLQVHERLKSAEPWRWEIYRAGRTSPVECSSVRYETVEAANRAGKDALKQLLTEFPDYD